MITKTIVPLEWKRYKDRLRANGWNSTWSLYRLVDNIFDEMCDQYCVDHGMEFIEDDMPLFDQLWELAEMAAADLDGEW